MIIGKVVESEDLNKEAKEIREPEEAAEVIKKGIISITYYQGKDFLKDLK